ncbi:MAG: hypothetical protein JWN81_645, partial [Solirubrobacterales bacterium]|nr:hypothetical protein [Solirubrobacterales bacterium]
MVAKCLDEADETIVVTGCLPARGRATARASAAALLAAVGLLVLTSNAFAGNFVATGHDMDFHCASGTPEECQYLKIVVDKLRNGSSLPILALDQGTEVGTALAAAGFTGTGEVVTVDPSNAEALNATAFVNGSSQPSYSAIINASDTTCGGCDNTAAGEANINARATDFETYFNAGGGILALAGAEEFATYYNFIPLHLGATFVAPPFTVTPAGAELGITEAMVNCCATHNSFSPPLSPLAVLESDTSGNAETIAAFGTTINKEGFGAAATTLSTALTGGGQSGSAVTVPQGTAVADTATLGGANASKATGTATYAVYSDAKCEAIVTTAGTAGVSGGAVGGSEAKVLVPGTY